MRFQKSIVTAFMLCLIISFPSSAGERTNEMLNLIREKGLVLTIDSQKCRSETQKIQKDQMIERGRCLDRNTVFYPAKQVKASLAQAVGFGSKFGSIPLALLDWNGDVVIAGLDKSSDAYRAGLRVGDVIDEIAVGKKNGRCRRHVEGNRRPPDASEISRCLSGLLGTQVGITVEGKPEIMLDRVAMSATPSVFSEDFGDVTYIRVTNFNKETIPQFEASLEASNQNVILDLRGNLGGDFRNVAKAGGGFGQQPEEILVVEQFKTESKPITASMVVASPEDIGRFSNKTIAVLIDSETFSSGEILAGMLKVLRSSEDQIRLFGTKTYGKAQAQCWYPLSDGSRFKLTCMEIFVGAQKLRIHNDKLSPDVEVKDSRKRFVETTTASDAQYTTALGWLRSRPTVTTVAALAQ